MKYYLKSLLVSLLLLVFACNQDGEVTPKNEPKAGDLINYEFRNSYSRQDIQNLVDLAGFGQYSSLFDEPVDLYAITYYTTFNDELIECSGLISFPGQSDDKFPSLVFNHGTLFAHNEAPSKKSIVYEFLFSAAGYMTLIPDYIGFGTSEQYLHPYYLREPTAAAVVDMIKASRAFAEQISLTVNDQLFLSGYSEGGYVTLATQRAIELDQTSDLKVTASAAGAGGYNLPGVMQKILQHDNFASPNYLAYIIRAYNVTLDWNEPLNSFFNDPYADRIPSLINGSIGSGEINSQLNKNLPALFKKSFLDALRNGTETLLLPALEENSLTDWTPESPTRMYHGKDDEIVPFEDSEETFKAFKNAGANNLEFYPIENGTHSSSFPPMLINVAIWFEGLKED